MSIARVILHATQVLILDEATSTLDTAIERQVRAELGPLMKYHDTVTIANRLSTILSTPT